MGQVELSRDVRIDNNNGDIPSIVTTITCPPPTLYPSIDLPPGHPATIIDDREAPPSYEVATGRNVPPPSYNSLFHRIEIQQICNEIYEFIKNIIIFILSSIGCIMIFVLPIGIPISMMIIGGIYLYDCPQSEYIPVYLIVGGGFTIFTQLLHLSAKLCRWFDYENDGKIQPLPIHFLIKCFAIGWFIFGSIVVYKEYEPNYDPSLGKYCNRTLYLFALWLITISYIVLGTVAVLNVIVLSSLTLFKKLF